MTTIKQRVASERDRQEWFSKLEEFQKEHKYINCTASDRRSLDQNALVHVWYGDIAKSREGVTVVDVRRECKLNYGVPILRRDDEMLNWLYKNTIDRLREYEKRLILVDSFQITSIMSSGQLMEYLTCMETDYPWLESVKNEKIERFDNG